MGKINIATRRVPSLTTASIPETRGSGKKEELPFPRNRVVRGHVADGLASRRDVCRGCAMGEMTEDGVRRVRG